MTNVGAAASALAGAAGGWTFTLVAAVGGATAAVAVGIGLFLTVAVWVAALRCWLRTAGPRGWARTTAVSGTGLLVLALAASLLLPLGDARTGAAPVPGAGAWTTPDGNRIAFGRLSGKGPRATPVVVLHGGPGVADLATELAALSDLTANGHDIYAYAQVGAGASSRLDDPLGYTLARAVEDLEQVRRQIGTPTMIVIGHSYGAYLAAAYLARYPEHLERVILSSPASIIDGVSGGDVLRRLGWWQRLQVYALVARPRALLAYSLLQVAPSTAHAFAGDAELDARMDRIYTVTASSLHAPTGRGGVLPVLHQVGFYANQSPQRLSRPAAEDLRPALHRGHVPVLVLKAQYDYLSWDSATAYRDALADVRLVYLPGAGHDAFVDAPRAYLAAVAAFVENRPVPGVIADWHRPSDFEGP
jgi:proline iminopeptidase